MPKTIFIVLGVLLLTLNACGQNATLPSLSSGIEGTVTEGPMCPGPVPINNNACPNQPFQATITILNANDNRVAQIQSDADGFFKLPLYPGTYILHPEPGNPLPRAADQTVVVIDGQYTQVAIIYDTGMR